MSLTTTKSIMNYVKDFLNQAADEEWDHDFMIEAWNEKEKDIKALVDGKISKKDKKALVDEEIPKTKKRVIMTPINLINPSTSDGKVAKTDYLREQPLFNTNLSEWDDSKKNTAVVGDIFAHVQMNTDRVELFEVINIRSARTRKPEWVLEHHRNRQVLCLSNKLRDTTWTELKLMLGYSLGFKLRGTMKSSVHRTINI